MYFISVSLAIKVQIFWKSHETMKNLQLYFFVAKPWATVQLQSEDTPSMSMKITLIKISSIWQKNYNELAFCELCFWQLFLQLHTIYYIKMTVTSFKSEDTPATLMKITLVISYKGLFMSLLHNLNPKIYQADLPVLFMVRNFYRSNLLVLFLVKNVNHIFLYIKSMH